jgi:hypothetical protein
VPANFESSNTFAAASADNEGDSEDKEEVTSGSQVLPRSRSDQRQKKEEKRPTKPAKKVQQNGKAGRQKTIGNKSEIEGSPSALDLVVDFYRDHWKRIAVALALWCLLTFWLMQPEQGLSPELLSELERVHAPREDASAQKRGTIMPQTSWNSRKQKSAKAQRYSDSYPHSFTQDELAHAQMLQDQMLQAQMLYAQYPPDSEEARYLNMELMRTQWLSAQYTHEVHERHLQAEADKQSCPATSPDAGFRKHALKAKKMCALKTRKK